MIAPRYRTIDLTRCRPDSLNELLQPGERVVSVYPTAVQLPPRGPVWTLPTHVNVNLEALVERAPVGDQADGE